MHRTIPEILSSHATGDEWGDTVSAGFAIADTLYHYNRNSSGNFVNHTVILQAFKDWGYRHGSVSGMSECHEDILHKELWDEFCEGNPNVQVANLLANGNAIHDRMEELRAQEKDY